MVETAGQRAVGRDGGGDDLVALGDGRDREVDVHRNLLAVVQGEPLRAVAGQRKLAGRSRDAALDSARQLVVDEGAQTKRAARRRVSPYARATRRQGVEPQVRHQAAARPGIEEMKVHESMRLVVAVDFRLTG